MAEYIKRESAYEDFEKCNGENPKWTPSRVKALIARQKSSDVAPVRHGRCPVCSGNAVLTQDCDNGYSLEVDAEQQETSLWYGDECLAVFHIDYCPNCGARMDLEGPNEAKESRQP